MANTPMRPPNRDRSRRRPPRGPRLVPTDRTSQRQQDQQRVSQLQQAATHLRETGKPDLADTVDFVLTDEGRKFIGRISWQKTGEEKPNLAMQVPVTLRDAVKAKAAAAGANLEAEAQRALEEFVAGSFTPARPVKAARGQAPAKVNLNVRVNAALRRQAEEVADQLLAEGELDWAPKASHVIVAWFMDRVEEDFANPVRKQ